MKFKKGEFFVGSDEYPAGTKFVAYCGDWRRGWRNGKKRGRRGPRRRVADETSDPPEARRAGLPGQNPIGSVRRRTAKATDPWQFENQFPLEDLETGEAFLFVSSALGGKIALSILCTRWSRETIRTNGRCGLPKVELASGNFDTASYKNTSRPDFRVVGWESDGGGAEAAAVDITPSSSGAWDPADDEILEIR